MANEIEKARALFERYAESIDGMRGVAYEECAEIGGLNVPQCDALSDALELQVATGGEITAAEASELKNRGLSDEYIEEFTGSDGKKALRAHVKWLSDNAVPKWWMFWRWFDDVNIRRNIIHELSMIGPEAAPAVPVLIEALGDDDPHIRQKASLGLWDIGPEAAPAIPALINSLGDEDLGVRLNAGYALANIGEPAVRELLEDAILTSGSWIMRINAISVFEKIDVKDAMLGLMTLEYVEDHDPNIYIRDAASHAIERIRRDTL